MRIDIDIQDTIDEFGMSQGEVDIMAKEIQQSLLLEIHRQWIEAANNELNSTKENYVRGIQLFDGGVKLVGTFNNMVENGVGAFDLKQIMENSTKRKTTKNGGWYLTVPLRWATPNAIASSAAFVGKMPKAIYNLINSSKAHISASGTRSLNKEILPDKHKILSTRKKIKNQIIGKTYDEYTHKSSFFEGLTKLSTKKSQGQYGTFRRISSNSDPMSWIHTGIKQYNLSQKADANTDTDIIVNNSVDRVLSDFGY